MNRQRRPETDFSQRLRTELTQFVVERGRAESAVPPTPGTKARSFPRRLRGVRLGLSVSAIGGILVAILIFSAGGSHTSPAFAVEPKPEGIINVEIRSLDDAKGLEEALDAAGVPSSVNYLAAGMTCKEPRFRQVPTPGGVRALTQAKAEPESNPGKGPIGAAPGLAVSGPLTYSISRDAVGPGQTLIITASAEPEGLFGNNAAEIAEGAVAPCEPVPVSTP